MQSRNPILEDISRLAAGAAGAARAAQEEARTLFRSQADRLVAEIDLVRQEEVDVLKDLLKSALQRIESLEKQVSALAGASSNPPKTPIGKK